MTKSRNSDQGISERLAYLRRIVFGPRGRAAFARAIGISPSTYNYYEKGRSAPAEILMRAAEAAGAHLDWLMTGQGNPFPIPMPEGSDIKLSPESREILARFLAPTDSSPQASAAQASLQALLARMEKTLPSSKGTWQRPAPKPSPHAIPIVGRTAAGLLASWENFFAGHDDPQMLDRLIQRTEVKDAQRCTGDIQAADPQYESVRPPDTSAFLTQLSAPTPEGVVEFLDLPGIGDLGPGAFAMRVDGDSMAPRLLDGDLVVARRDAAPQPGQTAIVKIRDKVGVTVKLWRPEGDRIHLIPINEVYEQAKYPRKEIRWACRVLWVVRL